MGCAPSTTVCPVWCGQIYSTERACLANAEANAVGWEPPTVDHGSVSAAQQLENLIELVGDAVNGRGGILKILPAYFARQIGAGSLVEAVRRVSEAVELGFVSADRPGTGVMKIPDTGHPQGVHTNIVLTARGERRFMSINAGRQRKGISELVDHVGRVLTETGCPVPQIEGHGGSSVSREEGFVTSVMHEALDTGLIGASPNKVLEFFGQPCKLLNVDLTESGWALYRERSTPHVASESVQPDHVDTKPPASETIRDPSSHAGIPINARQVNIRTAVGGDVTSHVQGSQDSSASSPEPFWKRHRRTTILGVLALAVLVVLGIAGEEFIERATRDLYNRFFTTQSRVSGTP